MINDSDSIINVTKIGNMFMYVITRIDKYNSIITKTIKQVIYSNDYI